MSISTPDAYFERIHRTVSALDEDNIKIIRAMKKFGPRNLQQISRKSGVPYPTVYTRVNKLEEQRLLHTWAYPNFSKIGLSRAMVLLTPVPGRELLAREALKIPGYWLTTVRCSGECNGYYSIHGVPVENRQDFEHYLDQLIPQGLAASYRIFWLGEHHPNIPNFDYYELKKQVWKFPWSTWLKQFTEERKREKREEVEEDRGSFDKNDLLILKELHQDARKKLTEFAKMIGVTLPAAKYRFDNIVRKGLIQDYVIWALPFSPEISELYEVRFDFKGENIMNSREKVLRELPFVLGYSRIKAADSITARVYLPRGEVNNLLTLLSALVRRKVLDRFSCLALDYMTIENQTFSYEYFENGKGWHYDNRSFLDSLRKLASNREGDEAQPVSFRATCLSDVTLF